MLFIEYVSIYFCEEGKNHSFQRHIHSITCWQSILCKNIQSFFLVNPGVGMIMVNLEMVQIHGHPIL